MDTVGDFLTILRNAVSAQKVVFDVQFSRVRTAIARILKNTGYVDGFEEITNSRGHRRLRVTLRYVDGKSPIHCIVRHSKPGRRIYSGAKEIGCVLNGLGIAVISTSQGLMRDAEARRRNIGGEILCKIW
ncbi:MAG: 30S ribosomal protein S8 [Puniceicoccales bacterium]|jgi:small subunit ribosomal protein S8|nr:30S ribosomal protein S8 [Puniceicoccales bacterium]